MMLYKYSVLSRNSRYIPLHHVWILSAAKLIYLDSPTTTFHHCGFNMGMDKSRISGVQSTSWLTRVSDRWQTEPRNQTKTPGYPVMAIFIATHLLDRTLI